MATFVLVHGAWHGAWCWQRVARRLRTQHEVYAQSLTGLADRAHLLTPSINLDTHIADIVSLVICEDLTDVVLVGHSYGGLPTTGAAAILGDRVRAVVYLDAFVPQDGESGAALGGIPPAVGTSMPPPPAVFFGLDGADAAWVDRRMTPHPSAASNQPIRLGAWEDPPHRTYVQATGWVGLDHFRSQHDRAVKDSTWTALTLDGGHDLMIDRPDQVSRILIDASR